MIKVPIRLPLSPNPQHTQSDSGPHFKWIHFRWAFPGVNSLLELSRPSALWSQVEGCIMALTPYVEANYLLQLSDPDRGWCTHMTGSLFAHPLKKSPRTGWRACAWFAPIPAITPSCQPETRQHRMKTPAAHSLYPQAGGLTTPRHLSACLGHRERKDTNTGPRNNRETLWLFNLVMQCSSFEDDCKGHMIKESPDTFAQRSINHIHNPTLSPQF